MACLVGKSEIPKDLALEPRDCFLLWDAMRKREKARFPLEKSLNPHQCLPQVPRKMDVATWEAALKSKLRDWMTIPESPFANVVEALGQTLHNNRREHLASVQEDTISGQQGIDIDDANLLSTTMPMLCQLHQQNALPAIVFNYDRGMCNDLCLEVLRALEDSESRWKATSSAWKTKAAAYEKWKVDREKRGAKQKASKPSKKKGGHMEDGEKMSKTDHLQEEAASASTSSFEGFDPAAPLDNFSFADIKKALPSEVDQFASQLTWAGVNPRLITALKRGIAIHHSGCNRKYRQAVEMLFRRGFLRVVFATGTLALGINMPCVTSVFSGDSVFLTALNFRQASGRAGRRGFDLLGNVVFQNLEDNKICRLVSSKLPDLSGHFPLTTTLVLRLFSLLHNSKESTYAVKAIDSLLSQPRIYLGGPNFRQQVLHHLRFSIEYLRRESLLSSGGAPTNFSSTVCHLYFTETSNFAFHVLLKNGFFHEICSNFHQDGLQVMRELMITLSNLFGRRVIRKVDDALKKRMLKSPSKIVLPALPPAAQAILKNHNNEAKAIFQKYVATYVEQYLQEDDDRLPLSGMKMGTANGLKISCLPPVKIRSAFAGLSGHGDEFESVEDLCHSVRSGVFLEKSTIPQFGESSESLNAYLYDFWNHEDLRALEEDNGIRRSDVWFLLKDFSLVLATIVTSLTTYIQGPATELDLIEIQNRNDIAELEEPDAEIIGAERNSPSPSRPSSSHQEPSSGPKKKKKLLDSWEDEVEEDLAALELAEEAIGEFESDGRGSLKRVLVSFKALKADFDAKFRAMWA